MMADTWDDQHTPAVASGSNSKPKIPKNVGVPDDWELDEEEEEDTGRLVDLRNKQLWEDANAKVHHPMPSLIISRGTNVTPSLPLNQPPPMRILKRPSPSSTPTASTNSGSATGETLKEREARYHAARERIFGASNPNEEPVQPQENDDGKKTPTRRVVSPPLSPNVSVKLVREPRGPDSNGGSNFDTKGFGERKAKRPPIDDIPTD